MNKNRYNEFKKTENWNSRFIWTGLYNNSKYANLSVINFLREIKPFESISNINNVNKFWSLVDKIGIKHSDWCKTKDSSLNDEELNALKLFFIGCIGEYFFYKLFEKHNTLYIDQKLYTFNYVCPRLENEKDYGVDLTGIVSSNENKSWNCVFQVKFWNPYKENYQMTYDILSRVAADAVWNDMINKNDTDNIFVCWLNNDNKVSKALRNSPLWNNIKFIDRKVLNDNINNKVPEFWNMFFADLNNF